jgi:hypothetical protein
MAEAAASSRVAARSVIASQGVVLYPGAKILYRTNESARPATSALLMLPAVVERTTRSRSPRCAPGAMRMPNSLVRCEKRSSRAASTVPV